MIKMLYIFGFFFFFVFLMHTLFSKINNFLDIKRIIGKYFKMFNGDIVQIVYICVFPLVYALLIILIKNPTENLINNINLVVTILTSLFFAVVGFLSSIDYSDKNEKYRNIANETFNLMCFEILCSILIIILSFSLLFLDLNKNMYIINVFGFCIYYLLILVVFNVFIALKRVSVMFDINLSNDTYKK